MSDERQRAFLIEMAQAWQKLADNGAANKNLQDAPVAQQKAAVTALPPNETE